MLPFSSIIDVANFYCIDVRVAPSGTGHALAAGISSNLARAARNSYLDKSSAAC